MNDAAPALDADDERRTANHELFFDLVFVYGTTQISGLLIHDLTPSGAVRAAIVLALMWWVWSQYTWALNAVDPDQPIVLGAVIAAASFAFFAAQAIPDSYHDAGAWFAVSYFALHLLGLLVYWAGVRHDRQHRAALVTYLPLATVAPAIVLIGGIVDGNARTWLWAAAVLIDIAGALRAGRGEFRVKTAHFAERYGLIVLIALGEAIVAIGVGSADYARTVGFALAAIAALLIVGGLYLSYFGWVAEATERRLERTPAAERGRVARNLYTFLHFPIVGGIVTTAVAIEAIVAHPNDPLGTAQRVALASGVGLFLLGFVLGNAIAARTLLTERTAAIVVVAFICTLGADLAGAAMAFLIAATVFVALTAEHLRRTRTRSHEAVNSLTR